MLLSDPLSDYLPEYAEMTVKKTMANGEIRLEKATKAITVRDLFTMLPGSRMTWVVQAFKKL